MHIESTSIKVFLLTRIIRSISFVGRQHSRIERFFCELALNALNSTGLERLTWNIYDALGTYREAGIQPWEESWFEHDLPPSPARILVGGAGTGREVRRLHDQGYEVVAFDPAPSFVLRAKAIDQKAYLAFLEGSYEDFADPSRPMFSEINSTIARWAPYDAVLLGWGSFTHITLLQTRIDLLQRIKTICPKGPLLASFFMTTQASHNMPSQIERWGSTVGRLLRGHLGGQENTVQPGDKILSHVGFVHIFTHGEIKQLLEKTGYYLKNNLGITLMYDYPHATFLPINPNF